MALVVIAALAIVVAKQPWRAATASAQHNPTHSTTHGRTSTPAASVVLFADLREADSSCGCGDVIRAVRAAAARGVVVQEVPPNAAPELARRYHVLVMPTVLVLGPGGDERARFEGESPATVAALRERLQALPVVRR